MPEFYSSFAPLIHDFIRFRTASNQWSKPYEINLGIFDRYCAITFPESEELTQEMVTSWCGKRDSETNNSCRARIFVIVTFVNHLRKRRLTNIYSPELPRAEKCTYMPHAFTQDELKRFFHECDNLTMYNQRTADRTRKVTLPVFFRLLYSSGIRTNEARLLKRNDIDLETGVISICDSKGTDQHSIVLHASMLEIMRVYDRVIETLHYGRTYFFPAKNDGHYTGRWLNKNFNQLWYAANQSNAIARHIFDFLNTYAPIHKTTSTHTLKSYQTALTLYIGFLEAEKGITSSDFNAKCFDRPMIEDWLHWLAIQRQCTPETCNVRLSSLRVFLEYLGSRDIRYLAISGGASAIPPRKTQKKKVQGISRDAVKALMATPDMGSKTGRRDLALLITLYGTAARIDEILSMKIGQLQLDSNRPFATIVGKGNKVRTLYLPLKAAAHLSKYIAEAHGNKPDSEAIVFYSRNTGTRGKLTQAAISKMLKKHALAAHELCHEVPLGLHAHQLRHAKASHWLEDGVNIVQISFLLGHENLQTTMIYLAITKEQEIKALATLEDEGDADAKPKWKDKNGTLSEFCGLMPMKMR